MLRGACVVLHGAGEAVALGPKSLASTAENGLNAGKTNPFMSKELFNYV